MKREQRQIWSGSMAGRPVVNAFFAPVPYGHWMTTTFVAALRHDEITAPCVFDGR